MKHILLLLCFCLLTAGLFSQSTWNQKLPLSNLGSNHNYLDVSLDAGHFLIAGTTKVMELDQSGVFRGKTDIPTAGSYFSNFVRRQIDDATGEMLFLAGTRKLPSSSVYGLRTFTPSQGILSELELPDSLGSSLFATPVVLPLDDSTVVTFGRKGAYKVRMHENGALSVVWQTLLYQPGGNCKAAVRHVNDFVLFNNGGDVVGVNSTGQQVFTKNHPFLFNGAAILPDGIIACGANVDQKAVLVKLSFTGDVIWSQSYDDLSYNSVTRATDGGFVATGKSAAGHVVLMKAAANGAWQWSQEYQTGNGMKIMALPEGGYFMLAIGVSPAGMYAIKTDATGQTTAPLNESFVQNRRIETTGVQATFEPWPSLFFNGTDATLISPADSGTATVFSFSPWMAGRDETNELHLAAENYSGFASEFHAGIVGGANSDFKRVWATNKSEIDALRRDFLVDQALDEAVPFDLLTWPAKGNDHCRYNIDFTPVASNPDLFPAPFVDVNGDGKYNVYDGDYPRIKGDRMAWWMINDDSTHYSTDAAPLKADIAISAYMYDCQQNESVKNSIFLDFEIINRSSLDYDSTFMGFFTDFDLGCYLDDYLGCMPDANCYYVYNQDAYDDDCNGTTGFKNNIPVQTVAFQNKSLSHFIYFNNPGVGTNVPAQTDPSEPDEYYQYMQAIWKNGLPATYGGSGYDPQQTTAPVDHVLTGNPATVSDWSMCSANPPENERRVLGTTGPFSFAAGDTFRISVALTTHHNIPHPCPDVFGLVKPAVQQLSNWANTGILDQAPNLGVVQQITPGQTLTLGAVIPGATYLWSTGASSPTITVSQPGEYAVTVTSPSGCVSSENVLVKSSSGTITPAGTVEWTAFPNPATDVLHIACKSGLSAESLRAFLRNAQGVAVRQEEASSGSFELDLQGLPSGFYWVELWQGEQFLGSKKLTHAAE